MRFKQFIVEEEFDLKQFQRDCAPAIAQLRPLDHNIMLFRGMHQTPRDWAVLDVRTNRRPKDTPTYIHHVLDDWFLDNFGFRARSAAVFCTGSEKQAWSYGKIYAIFPIGKFEFVWSPKIRDLLLTIDQLIGEVMVTTGKKHNDVLDVASDMLIDKVKRSDYRDDDLLAALLSYNEIMVGDFAQYYAFDTKGALWNDTIVPWMRGGGMSK